MSSKFWTAVRIRRFNELTAKGWSASLIAKDLGTTRNAVIGRWNRTGKKAGIETTVGLVASPHLRGGRVITKEDMEVRLDLYARAMIRRAPDKDIARELGLTLHSISVFRKKHYAKILDRLCEIWMAEGAV